MTLSTPKSLQGPMAANTIKEKERKINKEIEKTTNAKRAPRRYIRDLKIYDGDAKENVTSRHKKKARFHSRDQQPH